jgi:hypothetical protein
MNNLPAHLATSRRSTAAFHWRSAHCHPPGSKAYAFHLKAHGEYIGAAQRAEAGDTRAFIYPAI